MNDFMQKSGVSPKALNGSIEDRSTALIHGWIQGSSHGLGALVRKSVPGATGMRMENSQTNMLENRDSLYRNKDLKRNEIPPKVVEAMQHVHGMSKNYLKNKVNANEKELTRGMWIPGEGKKSIRTSLSSAASERYISQGFTADGMSGKRARTYTNKEFKGLDRGENLHVPEHIQPYIKEVEIHNTNTDNPDYDFGKADSFLVQYDTKKLIQDNKIFAVFSEDSFEYMNDNYGFDPSDSSNDPNESMPKEHEYLLAV